jgi:hypothetical protein
MLIQSNPVQINNDRIVVCLGKLVRFGWLKVASFSRKKELSLPGFAN